MSVTRKQKEETVKKLKDKLSKSSFIAFLNFHGLSVTKAGELRRSLRKAGADYMVAKKTLLGVAAKESGLEIDKAKLNGEIGVAVGGASEDTMLATAREISAFAKKNKEMLRIIGGLWSAGDSGKSWIDDAEIKRLAAIPTREALLTQLAFILTQPVAGLARALEAVSKKNEQK